MSKTLGLIALLIVVVLVPAILLMAADTVPLPLGVALLMAWMSGLIFGWLWVPFLVRGVHDTLWR